MARERLGMHRVQELIRLHRDGVGCRESARLLSMSPNTERFYRHALEKAKLWDGPRGALPEFEVLQQAMEQVLVKRPTPGKHSKVFSHRAVIEAMLDKGSKPQAIYDRLRTEYAEFVGSLSSVKRLCRRIKKERGIQPNDVSIPVVSEPGEIAQVDFGYVGKLYDPVLGVMRKAWVFVMTLAHSRRSFMDIVFDQKVETFIRMHKLAYAHFEGVPKVVVPDNLKAAVIRAAFNNTQTTELNKSYVEAARHYGFKIDPTPAFSPKKKGIVESEVGYVKSNFFRPRAGEFKDIEDARKQLKQWLCNVAEQRAHATTHESPRVRFERDEKDALLPLPSTTFEMVTWKEATVHRDSHIQFEWRLYSVPYRLIGQKVWIRASEGMVIIYAGDLRVATHDRGAQHRSTHDDHLPEERRDLRHRSQRFWEERAKQLGPQSLTYVKRIFEKDDALFQLRTVQRVVNELFKVPNHRAEAACKRALYFENFEATAVRDILRQGLDVVPYEELLTPPKGKTSFAYQRSPNDILRAHLEKEVAHVLH